MFVVSGYGNFFHGFFFLQNMSISKEKKKNAAYSNLQIQWWLEPFCKSYDVYVKYVSTPVIWSWMLFHISCINFWNFFLCLQGSIISVGVDATNLFDT